MKLKTIGASLLLTLIIVSCDKDFLVKNPPSALTETGFFRNAKDAEAAITAAYNSVRNFNSDNYAKIMEAPLKDVMIFNTQGLEFDSWTFDANSSIIDNVWQGAYEGVFRANIVLQKVPDIQMNETQKSRIIGEAHFLRALFYWQLSTVFGQVPIITEADPSNSSKAAIPKSPVADVKDLMVTDLKKAIDLLPKQSAYSAADLGRASKGAAQALLGKVYLYAKEFIEAELYLQEVVGSGEYELLTNFSDLLVRDNNEETIFEIQYADLPGQGSARVQNDYPQGHGGFSNLLPTTDLVDSYETYTGTGAIDGRDPRLFYSVFREGDPYDDVAPVFKQSWTPTGFAKKKGSFPVVRTSNSNLGRNFPIIRFADVLLMYAEATNENEKPTLAIQSINRVRNRVNLPDLPTADFPVGNKAEIFTAIKHERRAELAFEHHYLNDLQRWGLAAGELSSVGYTAPKHRYFPIPQQELENNPNLTPSDGY